MDRLEFDTRVGEHLKLHGCQTEALKAWKMSKHSVGKMI